MKESDINFFVRVKVVNQRSVADDLTKFNVIPNSSSGRFTDIYGDSYISGFVLGGEFNALLSIKVLDKTKITDIRARLHVSFGPALKAEGNAHISNSEFLQNTETTIKYVLNLYRKTDPLSTNKRI